jgi:hypothetical protein
VHGGFHVNDPSFGAGVADVLEILNTETSFIAFQYLSTKRLLLGKGQSLYFFGPSDISKCTLGDRMKTICSTSDIYKKGPSCVVYPFLVQFRDDEVLVVLKGSNKKAGIETSINFRTGFDKGDTEIVWHQAPCPWCGEQNGMVVTDMPCTIKL